MRRVLFFATLALLITSTSTITGAQERSQAISVAGVWEAEVSDPYGNFTFILYLQQNGNAVTGTFDVVGGYTTRPTGNKVVGEWKGDTLSLTRPDAAFSGFELRYTEDGKLAGVYTSRQGGRRYTITFTRK